MAVYPERTARSAKALQGLRKERRRKRWVLPVQVGLVTALCLGALVYSGGVVKDPALRGTSKVEGADASPSPTGRHLLQDFPQDQLLTVPGNDNPMGEDFKGASNKGVLVLHFIGTLYMFVGLAIVCDEYFVAALEEMCERWQISEDVAGATFMAAGGSAPELFTSLMAVFVAESDVGFGTIVGSAVFNVLFVIGLCAVFAKQALELTWWPLARDCSFYSFGLCVLVFCIEDGQVTWVESLILLLCYVTYVVIMKFNERLHFKALACLRKCGRAKAVAPGDIPSDDSKGMPVKELGSQMIQRQFSAQHALGSTNGVVAFREFTHEALRQGMKGKPMESVVEHTAEETQLTKTEAVQAWKQSTKDLDDPASKYAAGEGTQEEDPTKSGPKPAFMAPAADAGDSTSPAPTTPDVEATGAVAGTGTTTDPADAAAAEAEAAAAVEAMGRPNDGKAGHVEGGVAGEVPVDGGDDDDDGPSSPFEKPEGVPATIFWILTFPLATLMYVTVPNCQEEKWKSFFGVTFLMSLVWIAIFSYCMVWWASLIGYSLGIPDAVMGLTILAGGTSIPDALSSVIVARNGFGDMAVSSSIGSNVFDINVGLPLPWLIKTALVDPGSTITIHSEGLIISVITLLGMVLLVVLSIMSTGWVLSMRLGWIMFVLYILFVLQSLLIEYKVITV